MRWFAQTALRVFSKATTHIVLIAGRVLTVAMMLYTL